MQGEFDFEDLVGQRRRHTIRAQRRRNIEQLRIPPRPPGYPGKRCSPAVARAVLLCLDEHQREGESWRIKASTIAEKTGYRDRGTIQRAITYLAELGYLTVTRTGRSSLLTVEHGAITTALAAPTSEAAPTSDGGSAHIRDGQRPHQMGAAPTSTLPSSQPPVLPPPPPSGGGGEFLDPSWAAIAATLDAAGVYARTRRQLIEQLPAKITETEAAAVVRVWLEHGGGTAVAAWGAGALVDRLREQRQGLHPAAGWPAASVEWVRAKQAAASRTASREAAGEAEAARQAEEQREREASRRAAELEQLHGERLDAMETAEARELAIATLGNFGAGRWLADRTSYVLRQKMLQAVAEMCIDTPRRAD